MDALLVVTLNLFLFDAIAVSVLPAATNIPWNVPLPCLLKLSTFQLQTHYRNIRFIVPSIAGETSFFLLLDMTAHNIKNMSEDDLLNMDYFLQEDDDLDDEFGAEGFYIF